MLCLDVGICASSAACTGQLSWELTPYGPEAAAGQQHQSVNFKLIFKLIFFRSATDSMKESKRELRLLDLQSLL